MIIKVCGMCEPENIRKVEALKIDYMGFIFYPKSPRYVSDNNDIKSAIRNCAKKKVGVFVNENIDNILRTAEQYRLDAIQLHGDETPQLCSELKIKGFTVIKAIAVGEQINPEVIQPFTELRNDGADKSPPIDFFLFDTKTSAYGGSGRRFDWSALNGYNGNIPFLLSGGITPESLDDIRILRHPRFAGIDLNSGFETAPALKDAKKIGLFISNLDVQS